MGSPKAQHEFVVGMVERYPWLIDRIAVAAGITFPERDRLEAGPTAHRIKGGKTVHNDAAVRLMLGDVPVHFAQVEVQREYSREKLATLRAYHGSEVRKCGCGGRIFVLSPRTEVSARFADDEERLREELAFRVSFVPAADLAMLAGPERELAERALAAGISDFRQGLPAGSLSVVSELRETDEFLADLLFDAMLEGCPDDRKVEEAMSPETLARLEGLPSFRAWQEKTRTIAHAEGREDGLLEGLHQGLERGREQGLEQGRQQGIEQGRQQGLEQGEDRGLLKGKAQTLIQFFNARRDLMPAHAITEIINCSDATVLDHWLERAFNGQTAEEIFR